MNTIEKHRAFLESLEGEKGLPKEMHGVGFTWPLDTFENEELQASDKSDIIKLNEYLIERCRRAESRQIPDLKERVKELMRDAMDATIMIYANRDPTDQKRLDALFEQFRALCEPEKTNESL